MSQSFQEGQLQFEFTDNWLVCRPEVCSYYTRHFQKFCGGCKEMDFLTFDPSNKTLWLIEVKNYQAHPRTKDIDLADEVAIKTRDVLSMLPVAGVRDNAQDQDKKLQLGSFWKQVRSFAQLRVVLHCELPESPSKLFPGVKDSANLQTKLRQKLGCVDKRALFVTSTNKGHVPWTVR